MKTARNTNIEGPSQSMSGQADDLYIGMSEIQISSLSFESVSLPPLVSSNRARFAQKHTKFPDRTILRGTKEAIISATLSRCLSLVKPIEPKYSFQLTQPRSRPYTGDNLKTFRDHRPFKLGLFLEVSLGCPFLPTGPIA